MHILIHRLGSLGDTVVALPCFYLIRQTYPNARITVLTNAPVSQKAAPLESILENTHLIDDVIPYPMGLRNIGKLLQLHRELRRDRFDLMISLSIGRHLPTCVRDYLFFKSCGIRKIIGLPFAKRDRVCQPLTDGSGYEPEVERLLRRVRYVGRLDRKDKRWVDLQLTPEERTEAQCLLDTAGIQGKFIAVSLGTKSPLKDWGMTNWQRLVTELSAARPHLTLVILGSSDEHAQSESILNLWQGPKANWCGRPSPRVSAALLEKAALFIGHDSGPAHLAAAVGTKCVVIYSAYCPPGQWFPFGEGHITLYPYFFYRAELKMNLVHQREALDSILVQDVLLAINKALAVCER